ncbi:YndM family protein [Bacillus shivajii]|uniref:DUF2512 family protein n=1 Tax=Bacillus shivajii TaxID=1983719 RepID=UPI001CF9FD5F|nr:DUF2512 family protein [Bacillus shivajii]UCZ53227.1 YndM family protein [Bacillus shivajii]
MKHLIALAIKYGIVGIVLLSTLSLFQVPITVILLMTLLVIIPAYIIGDLLIYRRLGNLMASVADFIYYTVAVWVFMALFITTTNTTNGMNAIFTAIFVTFVEALYHEFYIAKAFKVEKESIHLPFNSQFSTEFAKEVDPQLKKKKNDYQQNNEDD